MAAALCFALLFISTLCHVDSFKDLKKENKNAKPLKNNTMLTGDNRKIPIDDPRVVNLTRESLKYYDSKEKFENSHKVVRILSATEQMVLGEKIVINFEAIATECKKKDKKDAKSCPTLPGAKVKKCTTSVIEFLKLKPKMAVNCVDEKTNSSGVMTKAERLFRKFLVDYRRSYTNDSDEYSRRFEIFKTNLELINRLNENDKGTAVYDVNEFADVTREGFRSGYLGLRTDLRNENLVIPKADIPKNTKLPEVFDWRKKGAVTPVNDQKQCGSDWAFSVIGNVEGLYKIKYGELLSLSAQQLVDCDKLNVGCDGGHPTNALRIIQEIGGLELESDYPYNASNKGCTFERRLAKVQITGALSISNNESDMQKWLVVNGPLIMSLNSYGMRFYKSGIAHPSNNLCDPTLRDHVALIVGYGTEKDPESKKPMPYWIIKNSWGSKWGENGYYRIYMGEGVCGLNQNVLSANI